LHGTASVISGIKIPIKNASEFIIGILLLQPPFNISQISAQRKTDDALKRFLNFD